MGNTGFEATARVHHEVYQCRSWELFLCGTEKLRDKIQKHTPAISVTGFFID
jgi:hypothetical protein